MLRNKEPVYEDNDSASSVVRSPPEKFDKREESVVFTKEESYHNNLDWGHTNMLQELDCLASLTTKVRISSEVRAYLHNIIVFMRLHRAVGGGISAMATRHLSILCK